MKTLFVLPAMFAILLATAVQGAPPPGAQSFSDRLMKLSDIQKRAVLRRAILDGGQYCKQVLATAYQGTYKNLVMWTANCAKGGDYAAYIGPDGSVQVRPCKDLAKLNLPVCRLPVQQVSVPKPHR